MNANYLFTTDRLGFRNWLPEDLPNLAAMNADPEVMRFFPGIQDETISRHFLERMQRMYDVRGYCYWLVERLEDGAFIGFVGLLWQDFPTDFTPMVDVGWRLAKPYWRQGYASEGAARCLQYGFETIGLAAIYSLAPKVNVPSIGVMEKIGMEHVQDFDHPKLLNDDRLRRCALYRAKPNIVHKLTGQSGIIA